MNSLPVGSTLRKKQTWKKVVRNITLICLFVLFVDFLWIFFIWLFFNLKILYMNSLQHLIPPSPQYNSSHFPSFPFKTSSLNVIVSPFSHAHAYMRVILMKRVLRNEIKKVNKYLLKVFSILTNQGNANEDHFEISPYPVRMARIKKITGTKYWWGWRERGTLLCCWGGLEIGVAIIKFSVENDEKAASSSTI